jgi:hypothetical protein
MTRLTYVDANNQAQEILFDATLSEVSLAAAEVTEHPIEQGANVTDHSRRKSEALKLEVTVTDYPLTASGRGIGAQAETGRAKAIRQSLESAMANGTVLIVETGAKLYENMVLKEVVVNRNRAVSGALRITLNLVEVRFATSETVAVAIRVAKPETDKGKKTGKADTNGALDQRESWANKLSEKGIEIPDGLKKFISPSASRGF